MPLPFAERRDRVGVRLVFYSFPFRLVEKVRETAYFLELFFLELEM